MLRLTLCGAIVGAPCLLILMQPDFGECIIWGPVLMALLFVGGIPVRYLICIVLIVVAFIPIAINLGLKPYQQERITAFIDPDIDRQGSAWAINQSLIAIGSGGWSGKGFKAPEYADRAGFSSRYRGAQRLHFLRHRGTVGICRRSVFTRRFRLALVDLPLRCFLCR